MKFTFLANHAYTSDCYLDLFTRFTSLENILKKRQFFCILVTIANTYIDDFKINVNVQKASLAASSWPFFLPPPNGIQQ